MWLNLPKPDFSICKLAPIELGITKRFFTKYLTGSRTLWTSKCHILVDFFFLTYQKEAGKFVKEDRRYCFAMKSPFQPLDNVYWLLSICQALTRPPGLRSRYLESPSQTHGLLSRTRKGVWILSRTFQQRHRIRKHSEKRKTEHMGK